MSYIPQYKKQIDALMMAIASEFEEEVFSNPKKQTMAVPDVYWVAINKNVIVGTVGLQLVTKDFSVLKNMMLKKEFRGKSFGVSQQLIQKAIDYNIKYSIPKLYLGTMFQFKAAQRFYNSNGFIEISEKELPINFKRNVLDTVFFVKEIKKAQSFD